MPTTTNPLIDEDPGDNAPLSLRYDTKPFLRDLQRALDTTPTGVAIAVALTKEQDGAGRNTSVSFNKDHYPIRNPLYTFAKVPAAVKAFAEAGLVHLWKQDQGVRDMQSVVRGTDELLDIVRPILAAGPPIRVIPPRDTVVLRRSGVEERAPDTRAVNRERKRIERWNESMACAGLSTGDSSYTRVFVGDMKGCGRLIAEGGAWQNVKKEIRRAATLRGRRLREFDFSTTHPAILYASVGLIPPADSYAIDGFDRSLAKAVFNVLVNAETYWSAVGAVAHSKAMAAITADEKEAVSIARRAISEMRRKHAPIDRFFATGAGLGLMFRESEMAMDVLDLVHKDGQVAFCLHDGHLVEASYGDRLAFHMRTVADLHGYVAMGVEEKVPTPPEAVPDAAHEHQRIQSVRSKTDCMGESGLSGGVVLDGASGSSTGPSESFSDRPAALRRAEGEAPRAEPEGRPSFLSSPIVLETVPESIQDPSIPVSDSGVDPTTVLNAPWIDSRPESSEDASEIESPLESSEDRPQASSVAIPDPSIVETAPLTEEPYLPHRATLDQLVAVHAATRLVYGPTFVPSIGARASIRRDAGPGIRTVLRTRDDEATVWAPSRGPVLVRFDRRGWDDSTTVVAPSHDDAVAMAAEYLHVMRPESQFDPSPIDVEVVRFSRFDPAADSEENRRAGCTELVLSVPRPERRTKFAPIPKGAMGRPLDVAPTPPREGLAAVRQAFDVGSLADLPFGALRTMSKAKPPKKEFA